MAGNKEFNIAVQNCYVEALFVKLSESNGNHVNAGKVSTPNGQDELARTEMGLQRIPSSGSISMFFDVPQSTRKLFVTLKTESGQSFADRLPVEAKEATITVTEDGSVQCKSSASGKRTLTEEDRNKMLSCCWRLLCCVRKALDAYKEEEEEQPSEWPRCLF